VIIIIKELVKIKLDVRARNRGEQKERTANF
jgi:hypothetical protein